MTTRPRLWVFAGPNGAGKSSLVGRFRVENYMPTVNPDTIARALAPDRQGEPALMLKAGRTAAVQRKDHIQAGRSFALETTLTGHSELRVMMGARAAGYRITLVFVGVDDALISLARVRERVERGGHDVPASIVLRRYAKGLANLPAAIALADRYFILDNSGQRHRLLVAIDHRWTVRRSSRLPGWGENIC